MVQAEKLGVEAKFLIPLHEDRYLGSGRLHPVSRWQWLDTRLREQFGGFSVSSVPIRGEYTDPDTGEPVADESRQYLVALKRKSLSKLRRILAEEVAPTFVQKCIYFVVGGNAELVENACL